MFLIIKPTRYTNFSNLFLEWHSTCFSQFLCPSSGVFHRTHSSGICHTGYADCSQAVSKPVWHIPLLCVQWKTPDDGQTNWLKHVEFHSKNKFEKSVHLVGCITINLSQCTVTWTSNCIYVFCICLRKDSDFCPTQHNWLVFVIEMKVFTARYGLGL